MIDVAIWIVLALAMLPCCFCCEIRKCCCGGSGASKSGGGGSSGADGALDSMDNPIHANTSDVEAGGSGAAAAGSDEGGKKYAKWLGKALGAFLLAYIVLTLLIGIIIGAIGSSILVSPEKSTACSASCVATDPTCCNYDQTRVPYTNIDFTSPSGTALNGWLMQSNSSTPQPLVPILYSHGSGKNVAVNYRIERYEFLLTLGVKLFTYDYPGYGKSAGDPTEDAVYESALAARDWLLANASTTVNKVVFLGRSLGTAVTVNTATVHGDKANQPEGIILQSAVTSMTDAFNFAAGLSITGWFVKVVMGNKFSTAPISNYKGCLFEFHSEEDEWVPISMGEQVYADAAQVPADCKKWVQVATGLHDSPMTQTEKDAMATWVAARRAAIAR